LSLDVTRHHGLSHNSDQTASGSNQSLQQSGPSTNRAFNPKPHQPHLGKQAHTLPARRPPPPDRSHTAPTSHPHQHVAPGIWARLPGQHNMQQSVEPGRSTCNAPCFITHQLMTGRLLRPPGRSTQKPSPTVQAGKTIKIDFERHKHDVCVVYTPNNITHPCIYR
jgi:hypothetical protein